MASQPCWDARSQTASSSVSAQCSVKKSLHSPGVSAVLNLKVNTTADITTATVEIQDTAGVCSAASHRIGNFLYISCSWNPSNSINSIH